jgi:hypothetical protein
MQKKNKKVVFDVFFWRKLFCSRWKWNKFPILKTLNIKVGFENRMFYTPVYMCFKNDA